ncbi:hypothetical protein [uncultured Paracoccus sp.]|uniref:hypothetical protein n=1 Tax=uncultured Paracoccus sp. TaxID=189685 RepID=UPI00163D936E|nr:hypothetical protein [uncultured Paracoccus sp.]
MAKRCREASACAAFPRGRNRGSEPANGQRISRVGSAGDAEIWLEESQSWVHAFRCSDDGTARINATHDFDQPDSFLRILLRQLAKDLDAGIYGAEGEEYR